MPFHRLSTACTDRSLRCYALPVWQVAKSPIEIANETHAHRHDFNPQQGAEHCAALIIKGEVKPLPYKVASKIFKKALCSEIFVLHKRSANNCWQSSSESLQCIFVWQGCNFSMSQHAVRAHFWHADAIHIDLHYQNMHSALRFSHAVPRSACGVTT